MIAEAAAAAVAAAVSVDGKYTYFVFITARPCRCYGLQFDRSNHITLFLSTPALFQLPTRALPLLWP